MVVTAETKYSFEGQSGKPINYEQLVDLLVSNGHKYPHVNYSHLRISGDLEGEGGVVVYSCGDDGREQICAVLRAASFVPREIVDGKVEFYGNRTEKHVERSFLIDRDQLFVQRHAQMLIHLLETGVSLVEMSEMNEGAGAGGSEPEAWVIDPVTGQPLSIPDGGELQPSLCEQSLPAITHPLDFMRARAQQILARQEKYPGAMIVDTSSMPTGRPEQMEINDQGKIGPYIRAMEQLLYERFMHCYNPESRKLIDALCQQLGYSDWRSMHQKLGNMAYQVFSASHYSIGLPHLRLSNEAMAIPELEAIAVGDIMNSNLATLAEMLMMSTPMVFDQTSVQVDGEERWPNDWRVFWRQITDTSYPAPPVMTPENYHQTVAHQIQQGLCHTMDRAAYMARIFDPETGTWVERPVMHGRVRIRASSNEPMNMTGRVEVTGCSASPSLNDEVARNCFLQVLMVAAYEALTEGQHPIEFFQKEFPNIGRWQEQQELAMEASIQGFHSPRVKNLIEEGMRFLDRMEARFKQKVGPETGSPLALYCGIARERLQNLLNPAVANLEEYLENPQGPFSEVLKNMLRSGMTPLDVTREIEKYQLALANRVLQTSV